MTPYVVDPRELEAIEILGPMIQYVTEPEGDDGGPCVLRGTIPAHGAVPLHRHGDPETFYVLCGDYEAYDGSEWVRLGAGDIFHVPGNETHGFRNPSDEPVVTLITTTVRIGRFFQEIAGAPLEEFIAVAERYGHWLATPEENAAVGLR
jgi:mannose-6-phosphate isomerase-like protein (cupin superfamily)